MPNQHVVQLERPRNSGEARVDVKTTFAPNTQKSMKPDIRSAERGARFALRAHR
jgi:hypothetical protein